MRRELRRVIYNGLSRHITGVVLPEASIVSVQAAVGKPFLNGADGYLSSFNVLYV